MSRLTGNSPTAFACPSSFDPGASDGPECPDCGCGVESREILLDDSVPFKAIVCKDWCGWAVNEDEGILIDHVTGEPV